MQETATLQDSSQNKKNLNVMSLHIQLLIYRNTKEQKTLTKWHAKDAHSKTQAMGNLLHEQMRTGNVCYSMEEESMNLKLKGFINEYKEYSATFRELRI